MSAQSDISGDLSSGIIGSEITFSGDGVNVSVAEVSLAVDVGVLPLTITVLPASVSDLLIDLTAERASDDDSNLHETSKYAVVGMSEVMRGDLARYNIGVSVLCPGGVTTNVANSGRNRPADLQRERDTAKLRGMGGLQEAVMEDMLDASVIGDMVVAAILADDTYIFSHPGLKPVVDKRNAEINESFARWSQYRKDHSV